MRRTSRGGEKLRFVMNPAFALALGVRNDNEQLQHTN
jgi:hypothetical protein